MNEHDEHDGRRQRDGSRAMSETTAKVRTHADLLPRDTCPSLLMKHILTHSMADVVHDDRLEPGDGYFWCAKTCTPIGPDDELVTPGTCGAGRRCFDGLSA